MQQESDCLELYIETHYLSSLEGLGLVPGSRYYTVCTVYLYIHSLQKAGLKE